MHSFKMHFARELTLFSAFIIIIHGASLATTNENVELLEKVIYSTDRLVHFFRDFSNESNLDGIFGLHIAGEQLHTLLAEIDEKCSEFMPNFNFIVNSIRKLQFKLTAITNKAIPLIARTYTKYYDTVGFSLKKNMWKMLKPSRKTNNSLIYSSVDDEELSSPDNCFHELEKNKCFPSNRCWSYLTSFNHGGYYLTHELLFIQIGQRLECQKIFNELSDIYYGLTIDQLSQIYCSNILHESQKIAKNGFKVDYRDLFTEQLGLCGMDGYYEFFQSDWIKAILSWQKPTGCYGSNRVKRDEHEMFDGCFAHQSAVALLALQQSITYLLKPMLETSCPGLQ